MRRAIVVAKSGDALRIELDLSRGRREPMFLRIGPEFTEHDVFLSAPRQLQKAVFPEAVEIRNGGLIRAHFIAPAAVEVAQPLHLAAALSVGLLAGETA